MDSKIRGLVHINSMIRAGRNFEDERVVELIFEAAQNANHLSHTTVVVDRATAARMINQLRKVLDADV